MGASAEIDYSKRAVVNLDVMASQVAQETVLLNLNTASYFGLDEIGSRMWQLATTSASLQAAYEAFLAEYDVEAETLRGDFTTLLQKLLAAGLIELQ